MNTILYLECSPRGADSYSAQVAREAVEGVRQRSPQARLLYRNLGSNPPPHIDSAFVKAMFTPVEAHVADDTRALSLSEELIGELEAADVVVISTPMHNYSVPSSLKAWIDHIVRVHRTFRLTPGGKEGLLADRPVHVMIASGGFFTTDVARQADYLSTYLRDVFATIGIRDVRFVTMEGMGRDGEARRAALDQARGKAAESLLTSLAA